MSKPRETVFTMRLVLVPQTYSWHLQKYFKDLEKYLQLVIIGKWWIRPANDGAGNIVQQLNVNINHHLIDDFSFHYLVHNEHHMIGWISIPVLNMISWWMWCSHGFLARSSIHVQDKIWQFRLWIRLVSINRILLLIILIYCSVSIDLSRNCWLWILHTPIIVSNNSSKITILKLNHHHHPCLPRLAIQIITPRLVHNIVLLKLFDLSWWL